MIINEKEIMDVVQYDTFFGKDSKFDVKDNNSKEDNILENH